MINYIPLILHYEIISKVSYKYPFATGISLLYWNGNTFPEIISTWGVRIFSYHNIREIFFHKSTNVLSKKNKPKGLFQKHWSLVTQKSDSIKHSIKFHV